MFSLRKTLSSPTCRVRRKLPWLMVGILLFGLLGLESSSLVSSPPKEKSQAVILPVQTITKGPKHHFFGYYDKCPWSQSGRYVLANEIGFCDRQPKPGETLTVGMVDREEGDRYLPLDKTPARCWQLGTK